MPRHLLPETLLTSAAVLSFNGIYCFLINSKKYKKTHPNVSLIFVTPYIREEYQKAHLGFHNERYDGMVYPPIENIPLKFAILYRNKYMVEESDFVIAYITHNYGGAYKMYSYAKSKGKNVINIADN